MNIDSTELLENELLGYSYKKLRANPDALLALSEARFQALQAELVKFFSIEADGSEDAIRIRTIEVSSTPDRDLKSVIRKDVSILGTKQVVALNFKDSIKDSCLPLFTVAMSLLFNLPSVTDLLPFIEIGKIVWSKLVVLKRPEDTEVIDTLEALLCCCADYLGQGLNKNPSTLEIEQKSSLTRESTIAALQRLVELRIIHSAGGHGVSDFGYPAQEWKLLM